MHHIPSLANATLSELQAGLRTGSFSSRDLVQTYINRIEEVNDKLNAVLEINPDALSIATLLDEERNNEKLRGPLHGIPILIKDNIATFDQMQTTAGSFVLVDTRCSRDSSLVRFLRKCGAIILGKTNMSEWANFRSAEASDGWSPRGGSTYGVYHSQQYTCGSSSGSAVAASVGLAFAAIGTETDGSITCPSSYNNIVGIKATRGLVPRDLIISGSETQDSVGPMARTVKDAAIILNAIAGRSEYDHATEEIPYQEMPDFAAGCVVDALKGTRIGVLENLLPTEDETISNAFTATRKILQEKGATVVTTDFPHLDTLNRLEKNKVVYRGVADGLAQYLKGLTVNPHGLRSLEDIIDIIKNDPREEYPRYDLKRFEQALVSPEKESEEYQQILSEARRLTGQDGLLAVMDSHNLDAIVLPESSKKATSIAAMGGFPVITVPTGCYPKDTPLQYHRFGAVTVGPQIPFGMQIIGRRFDEQKLIGLAYSYEQATRVRDKLTPIIKPVSELPNFEVKC